LSKSQIFKTLEKKLFDRTEIIEIPEYQDCRRLGGLLNCCCPSKKRLAYEKTLDFVKADIEKNLDLLTVMRRLRSHGTALNFLLDGKLCNLIT
jgi:hypothetical protein